ncbi:hypothetical protein PI125_g6537 [Phytophthora idaei]|nr:hypothetical protein PI125_g6537 [Phytophthora idaei]
MVFKHHGMPLDIVSDRDPRFTVRFWQEVFTLLGTQLSMSTADHPQTDGQTERVNRVPGDLLKNYAYSIQQWSDCLPMAEFAINNSVHASGFRERDDGQEQHVCAGRRRRTGQACRKEERRAEQTMQHASNGLCPAPTSGDAVCPELDSSFCG